MIKENMNMTKYLCAAAIAISMSPAIAMSAEQTAFRKAIAREVSDGVYLDDEYVTAIDGPLHASCFRVAEGETLLLAGDNSLQGGRVSFALPHAAAHVEAFDEYCRPLAVLAEGNTVTVTMGGNRLARIHVQDGR